MVWRSARKFTTRLKRMRRIPTVCCSRNRAVVHESSVNQSESLCVGHDAPCHHPANEGRTARDSSTLSEKKHELTLDSQQDHTQTNSLHEARRDHPRQLGGAHRVARLVVVPGWSNAAKWQLGLRAAEKGHRFLRWSEAPGVEQPQAFRCNLMSRRWPAMASQRRPL